MHNGSIEFTIQWAPGKTLVVESSSTLADPAWTPLATNTLINGTFNFSDTNSTQANKKIYRLLSSP